MMTTPQKRASRRRTAAAMLGIGLFLVLFATWAVPEGIIHVAHAAADEAPVPMSTLGWFSAVSGPIALVLGGVLSIVGYQLLRVHREPRTAEDVELDEQWGDEVLMDYDPASSHPGHRAARDRDRWG